MGFMFVTESGTLYTVSDTDNPNRCLLSGGVYHNNEIYNDFGLVSECHPFSAVFTHHPDNVARNIAGGRITTSPIKSLHRLVATNSVTYESRVNQAERLTQNIQGYANDGYQYQ